MSKDSDRIAVPTNGKGPHPVAAPLAPLRGEPPTAGVTVAPDDEASSSPFTPTQIAVGFGIVASLVAILVGAARRRRPND